MSEVTIVANSTRPAPFAGLNTNTPSHDSESAASQFGSVLQKNMAEGRASNSTGGENNDHPEKVIDSLLTTCQQTDEKDGEQSDVSAQEQLLSIQALPVATPFTAAHVSTGTDSSAVIAPSEVGVEQNTAPLIEAQPVTLALPETAIPAQQQAEATAIAPSTAQLTASPTADIAPTTNTVSLIDVEFQAAIEINNSITVNGVALKEQPATEVVAQISAPLEAATVNTPAAITATVNPAKKTENTAGKSEDAMLPRQAVPADLSDERYEIAAEAAIQEEQPSGKAIKQDRAVLIPYAARQPLNSEVAEPADSTTDSLPETILPAKAVKAAAPSENKMSEHKEADDDSNGTPAQGARTSNSEMAASDKTDGSVRAFEQNLQIVAPREAVTPTKLSRPENVHTAAWVDRIVSDAQLHKLGENKSITVRLDPPEFGALNVTVTARRGGELVARIETPSLIVRDSLDARLTELKQSFANAGIHVDECQVSLNLQTSNGRHPGSQQTGQFQQQAPRFSIPGEARPVQSTLPADLSLAPMMRRGNDGMLDLFA